MFKELINIEGFIKNNFTIIQEQTIKDQDLLEICKEHKDKAVFIESESHTYTYLFQKQDQVYLLPSATVHLTDDKALLLESLQEHFIILIQDEENNIIGYLDAKYLFKNITYQLNYLDTYANTLMKTIDESYTVIDENERVLFWTKGAEKIFSIAAEDIIGEKITRFFNKSQLEILNTLKTGEAAKNKKHYPGEGLIVIIDTKPITLGKDIIGAIVTEKDITNIIHLNNELYEATQRLYNLETEINHTSLNPLNDILGNSPKIQRTKRLLYEIAESPSNVLITGEAGVGKELFAKTIHRQREGEGAPFIPVNCNTIPEALFESEMFGYEAVISNKPDQTPQKGKAELAHGGTLFLNEISDLSLDSQEKLVNLLEKKSFYRIGGTEEVSSDFKVIASSKEDLSKLVTEGKFNEALYYRLNGAELEIPPLRERTEDIIELTHYYIHEYSVRYNQPIHGISQQIMKALLSYDWPKNIRELKSTVERLVVFSEDGFLKAKTLPFYEEFKDSLDIGDEFIQNQVEKPSLPLKQQLEKHEKEIIIAELEKVDGNKKECADNLGITRATLYNRMERLKIDF